MERSPTWFRRCAVFPPPPKLHEDRPKTTLGCGAKSLIDRKLLFAAGSTERTTGKTLLMEFLSMDHQSRSASQNGPHMGRADRWFLPRNNPGAPSR